jgi:fumarate reductase subunit D
MVTTPPAVNGHPPEQDSSDAESSDSRFLLYIIGGIVSAFFVGIIILVVSLVIDWDPS